MSEKTYILEYDGPEVDTGINKALHSGSSILESFEASPINLNTLVMSGNYVIEYYLNGPVDMITRPISLTVHKELNSSFSVTSITQLIFAEKVKFRKTQDEGVTWSQWENLIPDSAMSKDVYDPQGFETDIFNWAMPKDEDGNLLIKTPDPTISMQLESSDVVNVKITVDSNGVHLSTEDIANILRLNSNLRVDGVVSFFSGLAMNGLLSMYKDIDGNNEQMISIGVRDDNIGGLIFNSRTDRGTPAYWFNGKVQANGQISGATLYITGATHLVGEVVIGGALHANGDVHLGNNNVDSVWINGTGRMAANTASDARIINSAVYAADGTTLLGGTSYIKFVRKG